VTRRSCQLRASPRVDPPGARAPPPRARFDATSTWHTPPRIVALPLVALLAALAIVQMGRTLHVGGTDLGGYVATGQALLDGTFNSDAWQNAWPPFFALFVVPLALLRHALHSERQLVAVWFFADLGASIALVILAARAASPSRHVPWIVPVVAALCAVPYLRLNLLYCQINTFLTLLCVVGFGRLATRQDDTCAGVLVALAASVKVQPALLLPCFALTGRPRALVAAILTAIACALSPALAYGWPVLVDATRFWLTQSIPAHAGGMGVSLPATAHQWANFLAGASISNLPRRPTGETLGAAVALLIVVGLHVYVYRRTRRGPHQPALDLAVILPAAVLSTPLAWRYHLVAMVPAYAALAAYLLRAPADPSRRRATVVLTALSVLFAYASELGAVRSLGRAVEVAERGGACTVPVFLGIAALIVARGDRTSDVFSPKVRQVQPT